MDLTQILTLTIQQPLKLLQDQIFTTASREKKDSLCNPKFSSSLLNTETFRSVGQSPQYPPLNIAKMPAFRYFSAEISLLQLLPDQTLRTKITCGRDKCSSTWVAQLRAH